MIFCMCAITTRSWAVHKRVQNFLGGEGILKILIFDKGLGIMEITININCFV